MLHTGRKLMDNKKKDQEVSSSQKYDAKFEKFLVRLPQGTRAKFEALGFTSGNAFIAQAVEHEFSGRSAGTEKMIRIPTGQLMKRIKNLGYSKLSDFVTEAVEEKLSAEEMINPPVDKKTTYSMQQIVNESITREKKNKRNNHEL